MKKRTQLWSGPGFLFLLMALFVVGIAAETFPPVIDVSRIVSEVDGFTIVQGTSSADSTGSALAEGDFNNDGFKDLIIGAPYYNALSSEGVLQTAGRVYFIMGKSTLSTSINLSTFPNVVDPKQPFSAGFAYDGLATGDMLGTSIASGDINGDMIPDAVICYPRTSGKGGCLVVFGVRNTYSLPMDLKKLNGSNGFYIEGLYQDISIDSTMSNFGLSVDVADVNNDGFGDICIGAPGAILLAGRVVCIYGKSSWTGMPDNTYFLSRLSSGSGFSLIGTPGEFFGWSLAHGDINYDGLTDLVIGAKTYTSLTRPEVGVVGAIFVIKGKRSSDTRFPTEMSIDGTINKSVGFLIEGQGPQESFGTDIAIGDINGDGAADIVASALDSDGSDGTLFKCGAVSVIFGGAANEAYPAHSGLLGTVAFKNRGIIIYGSRASEGFGFSVEVADVNGDGVMDVIGTSIAARSSTGTRRSGLVVTMYGSCSYSKQIWSVADIYSGDGFSGFVLESCYGKSSYMRLDDSTNHKGAYNFVGANMYFVAGTNHSSLLEIRALQTLS